MLSNKSNHQKILFVVFSIIILLIFIVSLFAEELAPHNPVTVDYSIALQKPDENFLFGTDDFGRCILSRILYGIRSSIAMALLIVTICVVIGTSVGLISGYCGGKIDNIIMRITDMFLAFPGMVISIAVIGVLGVGWRNTAIGLILPGWIVFARLTRGMVLSIKEKDYIRSAKVAGLRTHQIIIRYILPNIIQQVIIIAAIEFSGKIISFCGLTYLGMGAQPPEPELGLMLSEAKSKMQIAPWMMFYPSATVFVIVILFNLMSDSLRDILDPARED